MATYTFTPASGSAITFGSAAPYLLRSRPEGMGGMPLDHRLNRAPYQTGSTLVDTRFSERYITLPITIWGDTEAALWTATLALHTALNPDLGTGMFSVNTGSVTYEIPARPADGMPEIGSARTHAFADAVVELLCPYPLWRISTAVTTNFTAGAAFQTLTNLGNMTAPFEVTFNGPSVDPYVAINPTVDPVLPLNHTLLDDEVIVVTTGPGAPTVTRFPAGGGAAESRLDLLGEGTPFWKLNRGANDLFYTTADVAEPDRGIATIKFYHYFVGL